MTKAQTHADSFRRWFGDSRVVDDDGAPLIVYHGGFNVLGSENATLRAGELGRFGAGIYLTPHEATAVEYADFRGSRWPGGGAVTALYARVERPLLIFAGGDGAESALLGALSRATGRPRGEFLGDLRRDQKERHRSDAYGDSVGRLVRDAGFDGIFQTNHAFGTLPEARYCENVRRFIAEIVVFSPMQIKSATDNVGTFDPDDPDITKNPSKLAGRFHFVHSCVDSTYEDIQALMASERDVSLATFRTAIGPAQWQEIRSNLGYDRSLPISKDWHVRYYKGVYRHVPAYFLRHSRIEYIFTLDGKLGPHSETDE